MTCHPKAAMATCAELTAYWDQVIDRFLDGGPAVPPDDRRMRSWAEAYRGRGRGAVNPHALPEPYQGALDHQPVAVFLALNPGQADLDFQGRSGLSPTRSATTAPTQRGPRPGHTCGTRGSQRRAPTLTSPPTWPSCGPGPASQP